MSDERAQSMNKAVRATTGLRLLVTEETRGEPRLIELSLPFGIVGAAKQADIQLAGSDVSYRHAYLQVLGDRVFCVDLGSKSGIFWGLERRTSGWIPRGESIRIASYTLQVLGDTDLGFSEPGDTGLPNPLEAGLDDTNTLPHYALEFLEDSLPQTVRTIDRRMTLIGRHSICRVRFDDDSVSRVHCALVLTAEGLWVVDLLGRDGTRRDGTRVRYELLQSGCEIAVGVHSMIVWLRELSPQRVAKEMDEPGRPDPLQPSPVDLSNLALSITPGPQAETTPTETAEAAPAESRDREGDAVNSPAAGDPRESAFVEPDGHELDWRGQLFALEQQGQSLIILPTLISGQFRYSQVQAEINSLRRKVENRAVRSLVIDLKLLDYRGFETFHIAVKLAPALCDPRRGPFSG
jgi:pSer/pThr/pTyr-binding forkhead associated (FHA) protein